MLRTSLRRLSAYHGSASAGRHQTPIVDSLWRKRIEIKQQQEVVVDESPGERTLVEKAPIDSANSLTYPFSTDLELADTYRNPWGHVRVGRLLEDLDALAGTIAFEHCRQPGEEDLLLVTASVDRIVYRHRPNLLDDIALDGRVTWVGRSSMEIGMRATATWTTEPFLQASFTFVARERATNKSASINPLRVAAGAEAAAFELGRQRDDARKALRAALKRSPYGHSLDAETTAFAHELLGKSKPLLAMPSLADPSEILMNETRLENALIAQPQQRNTAGRVFGGFLMRRAYELAHSTAYLFAGRRPVFLELDEVTFRSPVSVGDLLRFESCVLYTSEAMDLAGRVTVHVEVRAQVMRPEERSAVTSNTFNFTFGVTANADGSGRAALSQAVSGSGGGGGGSSGGGGGGGGVELRRVLPATHEEAYRVMERYTADLAQRAEDVRAERPPAEEAD